MINWNTPDAPYYVKLPTSLGGMWGKVIGELERGIGGSGPLLRVAVSADTVIAAVRDHCVRI